MSKSNGTVPSDNSPKRPVGRPRKVKRAETKPTHTKTLSKPFYLHGRGGWLISYSPQADDQVVIRRLYYGYTLDDLTLSTEAARAHYASQKKSGMKPLASL